MKEHKNTAVPIWKYLDPQGKPSSSAREREFLQLIPFTSSHEIPPLKIGDLSCPVVDQAAQDACNATCKNNFPKTPCTSICTYRKDEEGHCVLWVQCMSCDEIPQDETPTGPTHTGPT
jgi:hypothetical protein